MAFVVKRQANLQSQALDLFFCNVLVMLTSLMQTRAKSGHTSLQVESYCTEQSC